MFARIFRKVSLQNAGKNLLFFVVNTIVVGMMPGYWTLESNIMDVGGRGYSYPYDMVWMAREDNVPQCRAIAEKYGGKVEFHKMVRVTIKNEEENIGLPESEYFAMTGKKFGLKGREVAVGVEAPNGTEVNFTENSIFDYYKRMYIGKDSETAEDAVAEKLSMKNDDCDYELKEVHVQHVLGRYALNDLVESENTVIFSDELFNEKWAKISQDKNESSTLALFKFPAKTREKACNELMKAAKKNGVKETYHTFGEESYYSTAHNKAVNSKHLVFSVASNLNIVFSFFASAMLVLFIEMLSSKKEIAKRYTMMSQIGIRRERIIRAQMGEYNFVADAALVTAYIGCIALMLIQIKNSSLSFWRYDSSTVAACAAGLIIYGAVALAIQRLLTYFTIKKIDKEKIA